MNNDPINRPPYDRIPGQNEDMAVDSQGPKPSDFNTPIDLEKVYRALYGLSEPDTSRTPPELSSGKPIWCTVCLEFTSPNFIYIYADYRLSSGNPFASAMPIVAVCTDHASIALDRMGTKLAPSIVVLELIP